MWLDERGQGRRQALSGEHTSSPKSERPPSTHLRQKDIFSAPPKEDYTVIIRSVVLEREWYGKHFQQQHTVGTS